MPFYFFDNFLGILPESSEFCYTEDPKTHEQSGNQTKPEINDGVALIQEFTSNFVEATLNSDLN